MPPARSNRIRAERKRHWVANAKRQRGAGRSTEVPIRCIGCRKRLRRDRTRRSCQRGRSIGQCCRAERRSSTKEGHSSVWNAGARGHCCSQNIACAHRNRARCQAKRCHCGYRSRCNCSSRAGRSTIIDVTRILCRQAVRARSIHCGRQRSRHCCSGGSRTHRRGTDHGRSIEEIHHTGWCSSQRGSNDCRR